MVVDTNKDADTSTMSAPKQNGHEGLSYSA